MLLSELVQYFKDNNYKPLQYCYQSNHYGDESVYFDVTYNSRIIVKDNKYYINNDSFCIEDFIEGELPENTDLTIIDYLKNNKKKL